MAGLFFIISLVENVFICDCNGTVKVENSGNNILVYILDHCDNVQL